MHENTKKKKKCELKFKLTLSLLLVAFTGCFEQPDKVEHQGKDSPVNAEEENNEDVEVLVIALDDIVGVKIDEVKNLARDLTSRNLVELMNESEQSHFRMEELFKLAVKSRELRNQKEHMESMRELVSENIPDFGDSEPVDFYSGLAIKYLRIHEVLEQEFEIRKISK